MATDEIMTILLLSVWFILSVGMMLTLILQASSQNRDKEMPQRKDFHLKSESNLFSMDI